MEAGIWSASGRLSVAEVRDMGAIETGALAAHVGSSGSD